MLTHSETAFENGDPVSTNESHLGGGRGEVIEQLQRDFPLSEPMAIEIMQVCEEYFAVKPVRSNGKQYAVDPLRVKLLDLIELILEVTNGSSCEHRVKAIFWTLGDNAVDDSLGHWTPAEGARKEGKKKFTMYKAAAEFCKRLGLPRRDDQRKDDCREKLSEGLKAKYQENRA